MSERTKRGETRERIYRFVRERLESGQSPSIREIQKAFGFGAFQTAHGHLERLVADRRLAKRPGEARGYCLPGEQPERPAAIVPILGRVQAGALSTAVEDLDGYVSAKSNGAEELFGLRVRGESMVGVGILPGDIVLVRSQSTADPGDIVVALIGDEATVKTLHIRRRRIELHPENPDFEPIIPAPDECSILGKVIEVRRALETGRF